ncbi:VOC family protein [Phenylobacterium sp.]|uniref:VOC family protein n=1 Tax=Phenylobacterium sp. TaxID=1871053 RepID=UPI002ED856DE
MDVLYVSSFAVIAAVPAESRKLYLDALGLPLTRHGDDDYFFTEALDGAKHFGVWPLAQAAEACFGVREWPADRPTPQACVEFEVATEAGVQAAADELAGRGHTMIHGAKTEPWGQVVARLQAPEGVIVGISFAPWLHGEARADPALA